MLQSVNLSAGQASTNKKRRKKRKAAREGGMGEKKNGNFNAQTYKHVYLYGCVCASKQTRTVSHAQWVKFHFEWRIRPPKNEAEFASDRGPGKAGGKLAMGGVGISSTRGTHTHTHRSKAQVATNANNLQVANVGGKRQQQNQQEQQQEQDQQQRQQPTSAETQKGQNKNWGKAYKKNI